MANIMSMAKVQNKPSRNGFDLSNKNAFTAKIGELLPVMTKECLPGDKFKIRTDWFTRTQPLQTSAYTRFREYYDFFFVPSKLLWRYFDNFITQMNIDNSSTASSFSYQNPQSSCSPYFTSTMLQTYTDALLNNGTPLRNELGYYRHSLSLKLLSYLDYGDELLVDGSGTPAPYSDDLTGFTPNDYLEFRYNALPLAAYQKIYADYYRFQQWEQSSPSLWNFDYLQVGHDTPIDISKYVSQASNGSTLFDLHYANWNKDLFFGVLPNSQYGDVASVTTADSVVRSSGAYVIGWDTGGIKSVTGGTLSSPAGFSTESFNRLFNFNILALRQAEFLQRWKEIAEYGNKDYKSQIEQHWNVKLSDARSSRCEFIGGLQSNLNVSEVVNTNLTSSNVPNIGGKSVGVGNGSIEFEAHEYGYLMCIYHCVPLLDYQSFGTDPTNFKVFPSDYAIPEMDKIGMQLVPPEWLANSAQIIPNSPHTGSAHQGDDYLGYAPRYIEYKTSLDKIHGEFNDSLKDWVAPITREMLTSYFTNQQIIWDYKAFKVNPCVADSVFAVNAGPFMDTDQLLCNVSFDCKAVRNLDVNGLPY